MRSSARVLVVAATIVLAVGCESSLDDGLPSAAADANPVATETPPRPAVALVSVGDFDGPDPFDDVDRYRGGGGPREIGASRRHRRLVAPLPPAIRPLADDETIVITESRYERRRGERVLGLPLFSVLVIDADTERPVLDAELRLFRVREDDTARPDHRKDVGARFSPDKSGVVRVAVANDAPIAVVARAPGHVPVTAILDPLTGARRRSGPLGHGFVGASPSAPGRHSATLLLGGGGRLSGHVLDETGEPLAGASVRIAPPDSVRRYPWRHARIRTGESQRFLEPIFVTDPHGAYDVRGLPSPGRYVAFAGRNDNATGRSADALLAMDTTELRRDVELQPTSVLRVRVTDAAGVGLEKTWVVIETPDGDRTPERTDVAPAGEWRFASPLLAGEYRVHANAPGLVGENRVVVMDGRNAKTEVFALRRGGALTGRLSDTDGAPIADVEVRFAGGGTEHTARSGEDGRFEIAGVPDAKGLVQIFGPTGFRSYLNRSVDPRVGPLEITLERLSGLRGRLDPIPACGTITYIGPAGARSNWKRRTVDVAPDGTFEVDGIDGVRPFDLLLWPGDGACHILPGTRLTTGQTLDVGALDGSPAACLSGRIEDADGRPLVGATIYLEQFPVAADVRTRSDPFGQFTLPVNARGPALLVVEADGLPRTHYSLAADPDRERIVLRVLPGGTVAGEVTAPATAPDGGSAPYVEFRRKDRSPGRWVAVTTSGLGLYEIQLPVGVYTTRGRIDRRWVAGPDVEVRQGETVRACVPPR